MPIPTWSVGQVLTADDVNNWLVPSAVRKGSDQSVTSSTTLVNDTALLLPVAATAAYYVLVTIIYQGAANGTGDLKWQWAVPSGTTISGRQASYFTSGVGVGQSNLATFTQASVTVSGTNGGNTVPLDMALTVLTSSTSGNLQLTWAQNTSSGTATTIKAGSAMLMQRIG